MIYRIVTLLAVAGLAVAAWLTFDFEQSGQSTGVVSPAPAPDPGYAARDAQVIETGVDGLPLYTLHANDVRQDPRSDLITLQKVRMTFHDPAAGQWQATADRGLARQDSGQIELLGHVNVSGTFAGSDQPAHITTETLSIDTHAEIIHTPDPVAMSWAGQVAVVHARGLVVTLKDHHVRLKADVIGRFLP